MARVILVNLDLNGNQILNVRAQVLASDPGSPTEGQYWYNSVGKVLKFYDGTRVIAIGDLSQITAPTADVTLGTHKITGLGDPTGAQDAATKAYVDAIAAGLKWKQAVRAASTAAVTLATAFENGDVIDGVTLATGDRVLIKDQAAPAANGIYVVKASGAPDRATDADTGVEILGAAVFVEEGTANHDTGWVLTTDGPINLGTDSLTFAQFTGAGTITAGAGLTLSGSTLAVGAGTGITVNADDVALTIPVAITSGGTGAITAPLALAALGGVGKYAVSVGDTSATQFDLTHGLAASKDLHVQVYRVASPYDQIECDVEHLSTTQVRLKFAIAPGTSEYRVVVLG